MKKIKVPYLMISHFSMDELVNISTFCNSILVKYGQVISTCNSIYIKEDDEIEFSVSYRFRNSDRMCSFRYMIQNFDFTITNTEVLINMSVVNRLNQELETRLNKQYADI